MADIQREMDALCTRMDTLYNSGDIQGLTDHFTDQSMILAMGARKFDGRAGALEHYRDMKSRIQTIERVSDSWEGEDLGNNTTFYAGSWNGYDAQKNKLIKFKREIIWRKAGDGKWEAFREINNTIEGVIWPQRSSIE